MTRRSLLAVVSTLLFALPLSASAATSFEITGWLPYWRGATSTNDVLPHLSLLTEVNPFVYSLRGDGTILDNAHMDKEPWLSFVAAAKAAHVRVVPSIMTSNTTLIHTLLSNASKRVALENRIAALVKQNGFDGVEIDFEGKSAADKNYFSLFLKGLYQRLGNKWLMCDIEARTPVSARYYGTDIPPDATVYANDFTQINKYCDRVKFMTYDQQGIDQQLATAAASSSQLYAPVADPVWVTKVITLAKKSIKPNKILIGVPTYGYEYDVTAYAGNQYTYDIVGVFNPGYATQIMQQYGVQPTRNTSGELMLTFVPAGTSTLPVSSSGASALFAATAATAYADAVNTHSTFRMLDWPDATSVAQKAQLAKDLGVRGIAIFKLDGGEDQGIWTVLKGLK
jgi:spore germination protein YaaH